MEECNIIFWAVDFLVAVVLLQLLMRFPVMDVPEARSSHQAPTPTSAGLVFLVCYSGLLYVLKALETPCPLILTSCAIALGILGFWDDHQNVSFRVRLSIQLGIAAICLTLITLYCPTAHIFDQGWHYLALLILWGGFMNAVNFCDGLNGLLGIGALIVSFFCGLYFFEQRVLFWAMIPALGAFLLFNARGKIFMGDAGSLFIGFLLPGLLLLQHTPLHISILLLGHLFFPYLADVSLTVARRLAQGKTVVNPHKDFYFHRLNAHGLSHGAITTIYAYLSLLQGCTLFIALPLTPYTLSLLYLADFVIYGLCSVMFYLFDARVKHSQRLS